VDWDEQTDIITFTIVMKNNAWMGIVLGNFSMTNSDMIVFQADGDFSSFHDLYSTGNFVPSPDLVQNLDGSF
jgi:hypothetical protein